MPRNKTKSQPEYEIKHRLTGAAILIFLAVVVIPLLLKEPGIEAGTAEPDVGLVVQEDDVFQSKIEPLNLSNASTIDNTASGDDDADDLKPALLSDQQIVSATQGEYQSSTDDQPQAEQTSTDVADSGSGDQSDTQIELTADPEDTADPVDTAEQDDSVDELAAAGTTGWQVRVGTFAKSENVESVSRMLNDSGFNARHTKVQTTLGEATRVWLGPYSDKETAEKVSTRLKDLTGEKGYVTKHTS